MLRSKEFFATLNQKIETATYKNKTIKNISEDLYDRYDIPIGILTDYLTLRVPVDDASDFILFALSEKLINKHLTEYFSDKEIEFYSNSKFEQLKLKFPIILDMIQITPMQWIGKITAKQLMEFRDAQTINYNERTQRTMERKIAHGTEYWRININDAAVKAIEEEYLNETYIPNTITLNLSDDSEADFEYDSERKQMIIKSIKFFDILDGYHRYKALSKANLKKELFDYQMELRIVCFPEEKAREFIWQEDQKTPMTKVDSDSYNQNDKAVYIAERVAGALPKETISRNKSIIDLPIFVQAINAVYQPNKYKNMVETNLLAKTIVDKFRNIMFEDPQIMEERWTRQKIYCTLMVFKYCDDDLYNKIMVLYNDNWPQNTWTGNVGTATIPKIKEHMKKLKFI